MLALKVMKEFSNSIQITNVLNLLILDFENKQHKCISQINVLNINIFNKFCLIVSSFRVLHYVLLLIH